MSRTGGPTVTTRSSQAEAGSLAFVLFCIFIISYLLHLTSRIPALGALRFDLLLSGTTALAIFLGRSKSAKLEVLNPASKLLLFLVGYSVVTLPLVEWPGSVLRTGLETFLKAACFYFFVVGTIRTESRLKTFLWIFVACQVFRALEPLYLHLTQGYWGSITHMGNWEFLDRLSGAPHDTINPNGLAFVVVTALPILHFLVPPNTFVRKIVWLFLIGAMLYVLVLTSSRTGFVVVIFLAGLLIYRSKRRALLITSMAVIALTGFALMDDLQRQRYFSLVSSDAKGAETSQGRVDGVLSDFKVALRRPLFGHGLGTSYEANANFRGNAQPSHNLYTEVAQELGFIGLIFFVVFLRRVISNCIRAQQSTPDRASPGGKNILREVGTSLQLLLLVYLVFSLASYGLSEPYLYLLGGLSVVVARLSKPDQAAR